MIAKIDDFIKNKLSDKLMVILGFVILGSFYFIGLLSYITVPIKPLYRLLVSSSTLAVVLRAVMCGLVCLYSLILIIKYRLKIKWTWLVIFCGVLLMTLVAILISPLTYNYIYTDLYKVVYAVELNPGVTRTIVMYLSSVADFAFAFCIVFILPSIIHDKKKILYILIPIVAICLLECAYSIIKEKDNYIYLINHPDDPYGGYNHDIGATFGNKEDWGAFLTVSTCSALFSIYALKNTKKNLILKIGLGICAVIFAVFAVLSLCKTAMLAISLAFVGVLIGIIYFSIKKSKRAMIITISIVSVFVLTVILFFATKGFGVPILNKAYEFLMKFIINKAGSAVESRSSLWMNYAENVRGYNLFFGMGKNYVNSYTKMLQPDRQSAIHNGFAYFFASYGLIGFMLLISLILISIYKIIKLWRYERWLVFILLGIMCASISFILAEAEVLVVSTSAPVFIYNILLVILPAGLVNYYEHKGVAYEN